MPSIQYKKFSPADLKSYPGNARRGDLEAIKESLRTHGQYRPVVVQESSGYVLAGNHTVEAARELGWDTVEVGIIDVDDEQARRIVIVDNRTNDLAGYDDQALADLLTELPDLEGTGFDEGALNDLLASLGPGGFSKDELGMVIKVPENPVTKPGEAIIMGPHLLHCGDALSFINLIEGANFDMAWTDPPYLIDYRGDKYGPEKSRTDGKEIANEDLGDLESAEFRFRTLSLLHAALKRGGVFYMHMPPGVDQALWMAAAQMADLKVSQILQWVKDQFILSHADYHYRSEPIMYGWKEGAAHLWCGDRTQDTVWEIPRPKRSKDHPTMKPVELAIRTIENSSKPGDTVFDPFAGAGTSLVAAMQTGRRVVMIELDPAYCDVIVERYERLTGEKAVRRSDYPYPKLFEKKGIHES